MWCVSRTLTTVSASARIGLLLGSRDSSGALVAPDGAILARVSVPNAGAVSDGIEGLVAMSTLLRRKGNRLGVVAESVGVGFPGVIDPSEGAIRGTRLAMRAWRDTPLAPILAERLDLPVTVRNDVVAALLGEAAVGAAKGERNVVLAYSSNGVGGAIMLDGRIVLGRRGTVGHLGHVPSEAAAGARCSCGGYGHLDTVASAAGMTAWYRRQLRLDHSGAPYLRVVTDAAAAGNATAVAALRRGGTALGKALGGVANLLEPEVMVLAGESADNEIYVAAATEALTAEIIPGGAPPQIRRSVLRGDAQVVGAALAG